MLLVDDILCFPVSGILWIFREIHNAALEEMASEPEAIAQQLRRLYMQLETGTISESEFDSEEKHLLDRLEELETSTTLEAGAEEESSEWEQPAHGRKP